MTKPKNNKKIDNKKKLDDLINLVLKMAEVKGWDANLSALDKDNNRYATVSVYRTTPSTFTDVSGLFEITCDKRVKISYQKTSFHSYGLSDLYDAIANEFWKLSWIKPKNSETSQQVLRNFSTLEKMLRRFHNIARQIKNRRKDRPTILIEDEYDIQDLLHALLRGLYDDIRTEEYCPSYAGGSSRMDFLLKQEQVVVETKMASNKLKDKQIGEQLIIDIKKYQNHPDCKRLICFVYDPNGCLRNPISIETDLSGIHEKLEVKVIVVSV